MSAPCDYLRSALEKRGKGFSGMYHVHIVGDGVLPAGHDFMLIESPSATLAVVRADALNKAVIEAAWAAYRALAGITPKTPQWLALVGNG